MKPKTCCDRQYKRMFSRPSFMYGSNGHRPNPLSTLLPQPLTAWLVFSFERTPLVEKDKRKRIGQQCYDANARLVNTNTYARPPEFETTATRWPTSHVITTSILLDAVFAVGTLFRMLVKPLDSLSGRRTGLCSVVVVATLATIALAAIVPGTSHATVSHIIFGDNGNLSTFTVQHSLGSKSDTSITTGLSMLNHEQIPFR